MQFLIVQRSTKNSYRPTVGINLSTINNESPESPSFYWKEILAHGSTGVRDWKLE